MCIHPIVPSLTISTNLLVLEFDGNSVAPNVDTNVSCVPSDLRAPVQWRYNNELYPSIPEDLEVTFSPAGLNHTATFSRVYSDPTSPPNRTYTLFCDLINADLPTNESITAQNVTVRYLYSE